jgi:hypothetical protein
MHGHIARAEGQLAAAPRGRDEARSLPVAP